MAVTETDTRQLMDRPAYQDYVDMVIVDLVFRADAHIE